MTVLPHSPRPLLTAPRYSPLLSAVRSLAGTLGRLERLHHLLLPGSWAAVPGKPRAWWCAEHTLTSAVPPGGRDTISSTPLSPSAHSNNLRRLLDPVFVSGFVCAS